MADVDRKPLPLRLILLAGLFTALLGVAFWMLERASKNVPVEQVVLTPEAKAYVRNLKLSGVEMKAHESYLKQAVVEITGQIANQSDRDLDLVEVNCVFRDAYGQVVLRERVPIAGGKFGKLAQGGGSRSFRLAFDNVPESWNQALPDLVIARILFHE